MARTAARLLQIHENPYPVLCGDLQPPARLAPTLSVTQRHWAVPLFEGAAHLSTQVMMLTIVNSRQYAHFASL
jgi:hypothetical protein